MLVDTTLATPSSLASAEKVRGSSGQLVEVQLAARTFARLACFIIVRKAGIMYCPDVARYTVSFFMEVYR